MDIVFRSPYSQEVMVLEVEFKKYIIDDSIAIQVIDPREGPYCIPTLHMPRPAPAGCVWIKDFDDGKGNVDMLVAGGVIERECVDMQESGRIVVGAYRLTPRALAIIQGEEDPGPGIDFKAYEESMAPDEEVLDYTCTEWDGLQKGGCDVDGEHKRDASIVLVPEPDWILKNTLPDGKEPMTIPPHVRAELMDILDEARKRSKEEN